MKTLKYEDENIEIFCEKNVFIKNKSTGKYYKNDKSCLNDYDLGYFEDYNEKLPTLIFYIYILFSVFLFIVNYVYVCILQISNPKSFTSDLIVVLFIYFLSNIIIHELGHIYSLKFFGRKFDKVGFRFNFYVFPAFYVQMNETYMLSRRDKIFVHSFGLFLNLLIINFIEFINIIIFNNHNLTLAFMFFSTTVLWNIVPILNSDGYKILLSILHLDEYKKHTTNHWLVLILQLIGLLMAVNAILNWIFYWMNYIK